MALDYHGDQDHPHGAQQGSPFPQEKPVSHQPDHQPPSNDGGQEQIPAGYYAPPVPPYQAPAAPGAYPEAPAEAQQPPVPYGQQQPTPYGQYPQVYGQQQFNNPQVQQYPAGMPYPNGQVYAPPAPRGLSLTSMILGLASLIVGFGFFIAPQAVGIVLGHMGLGKEQPQGKAFAITGLITNYLALLLYGGLYILFFIGIFAGGW